MSYDPLRFTLCFLVCKPKLQDRIWQIKQKEKTKHPGIVSVAVKMRYYLLLVVSCVLSLVASLVSLLGFLLEFLL